MKRSALAQPYRYGQPSTEVLDETRRLFGAIAERPFAHQREVCLRTFQGLPIVIATGTGSGKTEAFLLPIVDHCLRHRGEPGPKAVLVYPAYLLRRRRSARGGCCGGDQRSEEPGVAKVLIAACSQDPGKSVV